MIPLYTAGLFNPPRVAASAFADNFHPPNPDTFHVPQNARNASSARVGRLTCAEKVRGSHTVSMLCYPRNAHISHTGSARDPGTGPHARQDQSLLDQRTEDSSFRMRVPPRISLSPIN